MQIKPNLINSLVRRREGVLSRSSLSEVEWNGVVRGTIRKLSLNSKANPFYSGLGDSD